MCVLERMVEGEKERRREGDREARRETGLGAQRCQALVVVARQWLLNELEVVLRQRVDVRSRLPIHRER
eukprot:COSAG03_NODE_4076_length_1696_cov_38.266124_4_plen_69_part_00